MKKQLTIYLTVLLGLISCNKHEDDPNRISRSFDFRTIQQFSLTIEVKNFNNDVLRSVPLRIYAARPLDEDGLLKDDHESFLLFKGMTNAKGLMVSQLAPASTVDTLYVLAEYIGVPTLTSLPLSTNEAYSVLIGGKPSQAAKALPISSDRYQNALKQELKESLNFKQEGENSFWAVVGYPQPQRGPHGFYVLGTWDKDGYPDYLMPDDDDISIDLLEDLNLTLPERQNVPLVKPDLVNTMREGSIPLTEDAELIVTFISEGADYKNVVGYYTYPTGNPPAKVSDIRDNTLIFPNASLLGSGGSLLPGNRVQLLYLIPSTNQYTTVFPAGTTVAWILAANSFTGLGAPPRTSRLYYSDSYLNPEADPSLKKHNLVFNDARKTKLIITWEDMRRDERSDNDFNDLIYYATVTPVTAVDQDLYDNLQTSRRDADGDGVEDSLDEFPNDPKRAFSNVYPGMGNYGTFAFEDLWPSRGDYDFNDLVLEYQFTLITNAANQVTDLNASFLIKAVGASYHNGFGLLLTTPAANVKSVSGQHLTENYINLLGNGAEEGQTQASIIVFDDVWSIVQFGNTVQGETYGEPVELLVNVEFENPVDPLAFGPPPYNPFIILNRNRSKEVHLPRSEPTALADKTYFESADDRSLSSGYYYTSSDFLPWAINFPVSFDYPLEKVNISEAYRFFVPWAASQGQKHADWYLDKEGYRVETNIYKIEERQ